MKKGSKKEKAYEYIIDHVKEEIYNGNLKIGQKLPPEREMAEELGVGRNAVREAMRSLSVLGFVSSAQGAGNFVTCDFRRSLQDSIHMMVLMEEITYPQINELRHGLESYSAISMAKSLTLEQELELKELLDELETQGDPKKAARADRRLHNLIAENSKNTILGHIVQGIAPVLEDEVQKFRERVHGSGESKDRINSYHRDIIEGIIENSVTKIQEGFRLHLINTLEYYEK